MGGFFGAVSNRDISIDVFFGVDYHSHLGTKYAGLAVYNSATGFERQIHGIENVPFRSKFEKDMPRLAGNVAIGCISDTDPQPLMVKSGLGIYAITVVGLINNIDELVESFSQNNGQQFMVMSSGKVNSAELVAALINTKQSLEEGIRYAQSVIKGSVTILILKENALITARDFCGRLPVHVGKSSDGYCVAFESFAYQKLGYTDCYELGPGEVVEVSCNGVKTLIPAEKEMKICAFLWSYYGYPNSNYEGKNVEVMRNKNGMIMARDEEKNGTLPDVDFVAGVPDSGIPHAIGYANQSKKEFARPFIKYTPTWLRSFMPGNSELRHKIAKMKQIPVPELIDGKKLLFVDDSIVRGTQLRGTVDFLYENGAKEVHMRSACPPIMYSCKYLNFAGSGNDKDLITRKIIDELEGEEGLNHIDEYANGSTKRGKCMLKRICEKFGFDSLGYQSLDGLIEAIGIDKEKICTYCWTGEE